MGSSVRGRSGRAGHRGIVRAGVLGLAALMVLGACGTGASRGDGDVSAVPTVAAGEDPLAPQPLEEKVTVRVGLSSKLEVYLPILLGVEMGEFEKENIEVEVEYMPPTDSPMLLTQGKLDVIYSGFTAGILNLMANNDDVRLAYPGGTVASEEQGIYLAKSVFGGDLSNVKGTDFRGKKFMVSGGSGGSVAYFLWKKITEMPDGQDIEPTDMTWEHLDLPEAPIILQNGAAAGAMTISPYHSALVNDDCCEPLPGAYAVKPQTGYLIGPSLVDRKDEALAFFRAMARTQRTYLQGDYHEIEEVLEAAVKVLDQRIEALEKSDPIFFSDELPTNADVFPDLQDFFREFGDLAYPENLSVDDIYDADYVDVLRPGMAFEGSKRSGGSGS